MTISACDRRKLLSLLIGLAALGVSSRATANPMEECVDGNCPAAVRTFGHYQAKWRRWPGADKVVPAPRYEEQLIPTPAVEIPADILLLPTPTKPAAKRPGDDGTYLPNSTEIHAAPPQTRLGALPELPHSLRQSRPTVNPEKSKKKYDELEARMNLQPRKVLSNVPRIDSAAVVPPLNPDVIQTGASEPTMIKLSQYTERKRLVPVTQGRDKEPAALPREPVPMQTLTPSIQTLTRPELPIPPETAAKNHPAEEAKNSNPLRVATSEPDASGSQWKPVGTSRSTRPALPSQRSSQKGNPLR